MAAPALLAADQANAQPSPASGSKTYVLVHRAYGGGWIWRDVADGLRKQGHRVWTPTQAGLGERAHLMSRQITVDTHIDDVASVIETDELRDIILVGHSYGGVADRMTDRIRHVVHLDALIPENGDTAFTVLPAGLADSRRKVAREQGGGVALPVPGPEAFPSRTVRPRSGSCAGCVRIPSAPRRAWCTSASPPALACP